jgi:hypothetical protein
MTRATCLQISCQNRYNRHHHNQPIHVRISFPVHNAAAKKAESSSTPGKTMTPSDNNSNTKTAHSLSSPMYPRAKTPSAVPNIDGIAAGKSNILPFKLSININAAPKRTLSVEVEDVRPLTR